MGYSTVFLHEPVLGAILFLDVSEEKQGLQVRFLSLVFTPERAVQDNVSPCFSGCSRPEHATVRSPGGCRHERAHRLMASMGLSRLDVRSLSTEHCLPLLLLVPSTIFLSWCSVFLVAHPSSDVQPSVLERRLDVQSSLATAYWYVPKSMDRITSAG